MAVLNNPSYWINRCSAGLGDAKAGTFVTLSLQSFKTPDFQINENESKHVLCGAADDIRAPIPEGLRFQREANAKSLGLQPSGTLRGKMEIYEIHHLSSLQTSDKSTTVVFCRTEDS